MTPMSWYTVTPTITIEKARKILGARAEKLTDKQIEIMLRSLYALSERITKNLTTV